MNATNSSITSFTHRHTCINRSQCTHPAQDLKDVKVKQGHCRNIAVSQHHTDLQTQLLAGSRVSYAQGPAEGSGWACRRIGVSMGPGSAQWHVSVWLVGLTLHCLTDSHRHAQTAAQPFLLLLASVRQHRQREEESLKGAIYKKKKKDSDVLFL